MSMSLSVGVSSASRSISRMVPSVISLVITALYVISAHEMPKLVVAFHTGIVPSDINTVFVAPTVRPDTVSAAEP